MRMADWDSEPEVGVVTVILPHGIIPYAPRVVTLLQVESEVETWKKSGVTILSTSHVESER